MQEEKTEGIVLRSQDYKERQRIITLFTPQGLISLIIRNISRKNTRLLSLTTPFCNGEYHFRKGRAELMSFQDGTVLNDHLCLRHSLKSLQVAGSLANAILTSQMAEKPSLALFALYKSYHKQIPHFKDPEVLLASFYLKLLKYEGLLSISKHCSSCGSTAPLILHEGESVCLQHNTPSSFHFTSAEWNLLLTLDTSLQFSALHNLTLSPSFSKKIHALFLSRIFH